MDPKLPPSPLTRYPQIPPSNPRGGPQHRRAHSETFLSIPDDVLFDSDPDFSISDIDFPSLSDDVTTSSAAPPAVNSLPTLPPPAGVHHGRSLSVDAAFFEGLGLQQHVGPVESGADGGHHRRSGSMDGFESGDYSTASSSDYAKKAMAADKLAELALLDPKRAKRILANRQSAARSKERKIRYTSELERKVQTLQTEATTLSAQVTLLQRDTTGLTAENRELKLRLQSMEQQAHLRDALSEALREDVQRLKIATGQIPNMKGNAFNRSFQQQQSSANPFYSRHHQLQQHQQQQQCSPNAQQSHPQTSSNGPSDSDQSLHDSMDFM